MQKIIFYAVLLVVWIIAIIFTYNQPERDNFMVILHVVLAITSTVRLVQAIKQHKTGQNANI